MNRFSWLLARLIFHYLCSRSSFRTCFSYLLLLFIFRSSSIFFMLKHPIFCAHAGTIWLAAKVEMYDSLQHHIINPQLMIQPIVCRRISIYFVFNQYPIRIICSLILFSSSHWPNVMYLCYLVWWFFAWSLVVVIVVTVVGSRWRLLVVSILSLLFVGQHCYVGFEGIMVFPIVQDKARNQACGLLPS